ncbi:MAG: hypothetical protein SFU98_22230 [Leptospiraceae bacterium]|nr:hypothetical protein [Leptospiraceae bacterium]
MNSYTKEQIYSARIEIVRAQVERFHEFYNSYFQRAETLRMVEYFFEKIYNPEGKKEWVELAIGSYEHVKSIMKESTQESVDHLIELNQRTDELDEKMGILLLDSGWDGKSKISRTDYDTFFKQLGYAKERREQLTFVLNNMSQFYELAHRPINAYIMTPLKYVTKTIGLFPIYAILEEGYLSCLPVKREIFEEFHKEVERKENEYLDRLLPLQ